MYTTKEVAEKLNRRESFVRKKISIGHLRAVPLGNTYRIEESALKDFLDKYEHVNAITDGITIQEFCETTKTSSSLARKIIKSLEAANQIKVAKINNKYILPKDIYSILGFIGDYTHSKTDALPASDNKPTSLFQHHEDCTLPARIPIVTDKANNSEASLNAIKELNQLNSMVSSGRITESEFNTLKKALMQKIRR